MDSVLAKKIKYGLERKQEFLREVHQFLVNKKQGLETNFFKMQELEAFFLSQNSIFSQVSISLGITFYIFLYSGGSVLLDQNYH